MGIDAEIHVYGEVTQEMCDRANHRLRNLKVDVDGYQNTFKLQLDQDYRESNAYFSTLWRWWGIGYERGPLFEILQALCTAVWAFPDCKIVYGADNAFESDYREFTPEFMAELLTHYMSDDGNNYYESFYAADKMMQTFRRPIT